MLKYSRASWSTNHVERINPAGVARETLKHLGEEIARSDASIHIGKIPDVVTNRDALSQVFQNLIANAIKFNRSGAPKIEILGHRDNDRVVVLVTDNGIGIPSENRYRIFDLGFSTNQSGEPSGIGLAICRRLLTLLDGSLRVKSSSESGTTFEITLPAVSKETPETDEGDRSEDS
jgi:signal transduction histidine kinase